MKQITLAVTVLLLVYACQKEVTDPILTPAAGAIKTSGGNCLPKRVEGAYIVGKALNDSNFMEVTMDVATAGTYTIATGTVNGFSFSGSGQISQPGTHKIKLVGKGTPQTEGQASFQVTFGNSSCNVVINVLKSAAEIKTAVFTLQGSPNTCAAFELKGTYQKDSVLDARHTVKVNVNVTAVGSYTISTAPVNGYFFAATGTFAAVGPTQVILQANGKPAAAGTNQITLAYGGSSCTFPVTVTTGTAATEADFTIGSNPATGCTHMEIRGTYSAGLALNTSNTASIIVDVITTGTYSISTNTVNGMTFSRSGTFTYKGEQELVLGGSGTPVQAGVTTFSLKGGATTCPFSITVEAAPVAPPPTASTSYLPLKSGNRWSYNHLNRNTGTVHDTTILEVLSTFTHNNKLYTSISFSSDFKGEDTLHFAQVGSDYYMYIKNLGNSFFTFYDEPKPTNLEVLLLKENPGAAKVWQSAIVNAASIPGYAYPISYRFETRIIGENITHVVNGVSYKNVIHVQLAEQGYNPVYNNYSDMRWFDFYFAKGIGIIQLIEAPTNRQIEYSNRFDLRHFRIN